MAANAADGGVPLALPRPEKDETAADLPKELAGSTESTFDFDNNGTLDLVFSRSFENNYMHGSILLAQLGTSRRKLNVTGSPLGTSSIMVPCQMGEGPYDAKTCPPFSQKHDDAGFAVRSRKGEPSVSFRARYAELAPFRFRGSTYLDVISHSEDTRQFVAVLKPLPKRKFQQTCLLRWVPENF